MGSGKSLFLPFSKSQFKVVGVMVMVIVIVIVIVMVMVMVMVLVIVMVIVMVMGRVVVTIMARDWQVWVLATL